MRTYWGLVWLCFWRLVHTDTLAVLFWTRWNVHIIRSQSRCDKVLCPWGQVRWIAFIKAKAVQRLSWLWVLHESPKTKLGPVWFSNPTSARSHWPHFSSTFKRSSLHPSWGWQRWWQRPRMTFTCWFALISVFCCVVFLFNNFESFYNFSTCF